MWRHDHQPAAVGLGPLVLSVVSIIATAVFGLRCGKLSFRYRVWVASEAVHHATGNG